MLIRLKTPSAILAGVAGFDNVICQHSWKHNSVLKNVVEKSEV